VAVIDVTARPVPGMESSGLFAELADVAAMIAPDTSIAIPDEMSL
jgi:hypothetical protein